MPRLLLALLAALALVTAGCGAGGGGGASATGTSAPSAGASAPAASAAASPPAGCRRVPEPRPRPGGGVPRPTGRVAGPGATVEMRTNCGTFAIRLAVDRAPRTASSFAALVRRGFYDGLTFHRIAGDPTSGPFVIQGGDPLGTGLGGPGFSVVERPPRDLRYTHYTVAMAKSQTEPAGASGSQFFIVTARDAGLPPDYALVGRVTRGRDVVDRIATAPAGPDERPLVPVVIERATLQGA